MSHEQEDPHGDLHPLLQEGLRCLRSSLAAVVPAEHLDTTVDAIRSLLQNGALQASDERAKQIRFLDRLLTRCGEIDEQLRWMLRAQADSRRERGTIDGQTRTLFAGMREELLSGSSNKAFDESLQRIMVALEAGLSTQSGREDLRSGRTTDYLRDMTEEVRGLMQEAGKLHRELVQIRDQLEVDPATGLPGETRFEELLARECLQALREGHVMSLLVIDIDDLHKINSEREREGGNRMLSAVAETLGSVLRESDVAARGAGDEFLVMLPFTDLNHAQLVAEKVRSAVEALRVDTGRGDDAGSVTASCGVSSYWEYDSAVSVLDRARVAARHARDAGGNRVHMEIAT